MLLIDPGVHREEVACPAKELKDLGWEVVAGFSTHPQEDLLLWQHQLGGAPRSGIKRCADAARERLPGGIDAKRLGVPEDVPLNLLGLVTGLPAGTTQVSWHVPVTRILGHQAHAPDQASLLVKECGALVAGDIRSEVLVPMPDVAGTAEPIEGYLAALLLLEGCGAVATLIRPRILRQGQHRQHARVPGAQGFHW